MSDVLPSFKYPREQAFSGLPNEGFFGYCRAIKVGDRVIVSGTTALASGGGVAPEMVGDMYKQAKEALSRIGMVLAHFDLTLDHVIRTNVYITDASKLSDVIKAHGEAFGQVKPANTGLIGVSFLFHPDLLIEIDVEAMP